jgi:hypothetical protein
MSEPIHVPLGRGTYSTLISAADAPLIAGYRWFRHHNGHGGYYVRGYRKGASQPYRYTYMHALIAGPGCDHRDGDGLNNQRHNLRPATGSQNLANTSSRGGSSRFKGVCQPAGSSSWLARITVNYRSRHLGSFPTEEAAARAYDAAARAAWGEFARLNFPLS